MKGAMAVFAMIAMATPDVVFAPDPEDVDIDDVFAKIKARHPDMCGEHAIEIIELLVERELTDEERDRFL